MPIATDLATAAAQLETAAAQFGAGGGLFSGVVVTATGTAEKFKRTFADTRGGPFTLTLDPAAVDNDRVQVWDLYKSWGTHQLKIKGPDGISIDEATELDCNASAALEFAFYAGKWHLVSCVKLGAIPDGLDIEMLVAPAPAPGEGTSDDEFNGPFVDWLSGKDVAYGAVGDGVADDTSAFQAMLTAIASDNNAIGDPMGADDQKLVGQNGHLPAGTYRITSTVKMPDSGHSTGDSFENKSLWGTGDGVGDVVLLWDGPDGDDMLWANGIHTSVIGRITFKVKAGKHARAAIRFERDPTLGLSSQSGNRIENCVFDGRDGTLDYGIFNSQTPGPDSNSGTDSEMDIDRCHFYNCAIAGIRNGGVQSFNFWPHACYFEGCAIGITNGVSPDGVNGTTYPFDGSDRKINCMGSFSVFDCIFNGSTVVDVQIWGGNPSSVLRNFSINSKRFSDIRGVYVKVEENTVIRPIETDCMRFFTTDRGDVNPATKLVPTSRVRTVVNRNDILSRPDAVGPVISEIYDADADAAALAVPSLEPGNLVDYQAIKPLFFAYANRFSVTYSNPIVTDPTFDNTILLDNLGSQTIDDTVPLRAPLTPKVSRQVFVMGNPSDGLTPQQTVTNAEAYANAHPGSRPIVYLPVRGDLSGSFYTVGAPVEVSANLRYSIQGGGPSASLHWSGSVDDPAPYWLFHGPSQIEIRHLRLGTGGGSGGKNGVTAVFDNADQVGSRIRAANGAGRASVLGTANLKAEFIQRVFDSSLDDGLPMKVTGHATSSGGGMVLAEGCTMANDTSSASTILVQDGGRLHTRQIWFESGVADQVNIVMSGHSGGQDGWMGMEASRWVCSNQGPPTSGGVNWRFVQGRIVDFAGQFVGIASDFLGTTSVGSGGVEATSANFLNIGATTVVQSGGVLHSMYRNHGPLSRLEGYNPVNDKTPVGATGSLPANYADLLDACAQIRPTVFIDDLGSGITDVRMTRVFADLHISGGAYVSGGS